MARLPDAHGGRRAHRWRPVLLALATVVGATAGAQTAPYQEGVHYQRLPVPVETRDPAKLEVVEVFSYLCPHCYNLQPILERWRRALPDDVDFRRLPLVTRRLEPFARAYFTAEALGVTDRIHRPLFAAIHDNGIDMSRVEYLRRLFVREGGVADAAFTETVESFGVRSRVRQAEAQARLYRIAATPTLVVNGRYLAEAATAGTPEAMFLVVDHLLDAEREARAAQGAGASSP